MRSLQARQNPHVLVVDLDGSLIKSDLLFEGIVMILKRNPLLVFMFPLWLVRGKAYLKEQVACRAISDISLLPYNAEVLALIDQLSKDGVRVILGTAAHSIAAHRVAAHLGKFDSILATGSDGNLAGERKLKAILHEVGDGTFGYVGNARPDLKIWARSSDAYVVDPSPGVLTGLRRLGKEPVQLFKTKKPYFESLLKALRIHQWLKNVLVFVPIIAGHRLTDWQAWYCGLEMFLAYGLTASSIYLVNDLLDLDADRRHPRKRNRPFAAGDLPILHGLLIAPLLLISGVALAFVINLSAGLMLLAYALVSTSYTFLLKRFVVIDVITLAGLYTLRILAGAAATHIVPSFWLLAFSVFLFLSLATMKRVAELQVLAAVGTPSAAGRDYLVQDLPAIRSLGVTSGYLSVLVLAFYMNTPEIAPYYPTPQALWAICIVLLYWLGRLWVKTDRGEMHDDPVVYALTDWNSRILGGVCLVFVLVSTLRW